MKIKVAVWLPGMSRVKIEDEIELTDEELIGLNSEEREHYINECIRDLMLGMIEWSIDYEE